jgi:hypothetical protein
VPCNMSAQLNTPPYHQHRLSSGPTAYVPLLSDQTLECLAFFQRWLTPRDQEAARICAGLRRKLADYGTFQRMAAEDGSLRPALQRRFDAFEEAGGLILSGAMRADLFFDAWHDVSLAWREARPYVLGMRVEAADPRLYAHFEWLAQRADEYREETRRTPPKWRPICYPEPTAADKALFDSFSEASLPATDDAGWLLFTMLQRHGRSAEDFERLVPPDSDAEFTFERFMDAYARAGALVRHGILHPTLFFTSWRSPIEILTAAEEGVEVMKARRDTPSLWQAVAWLANFELEWHKRIVSLAQDLGAYRVSAG